MGQEYHIRWQQADPAKAKAWLQRRGGSVLIFEGKESYEFRFRDPPDTATMPDASVVLEEHGAYFCDHARSEKTAALFRDLIDEAFTFSDSSDTILVRSL